MNRTVSASSMDESMTSNPNTNANTQQLPGEGELSIQHVYFYWKQLIATTIAMSILSTNKKEYVPALRLLQRAQGMCKVEGMLEEAKRIEMMGYAYSAMAYYFFKCGKRTAALAHTKQAGKLHARIHNYDSVAISLLHVAVVEIQKNKFKEAHKVCSTVYIVDVCMCCVYVYVYICVYILFLTYTSYTV